jgi:hypothetical protein
VQSGIDLEPDDALIVARIVISVLKGVHENQLRTAFTLAQIQNEYQARGKKWLYGTGHLPDIPNMASQPLPDYLCAAIRDDASTLPSGRHRRPSLV